MHPCAARVVRRLSPSCRVGRAFWRALVAELRPHQWAKNALVVLPVLAGERRAARRDARASGVGRRSRFSLCASAGYVFNDLLDLEADRIHVTKAQRPFASGALPIIFGFPLFLGLLALSFSLGSRLFAGLHSWRCSVCTSWARCPTRCI